MTRCDQREPLQLGSLEDCFGARERIIILESPAGGVATAETCRRVFDTASPDAYVVIALRIAGGVGRLTRLAGLITLPARVAAAKRAILCAGGTRLEGCYGVYPALEAPTFVYELGGPADAYATTHLIPGRSAGISGWLRRALARWIGCEPSLGAVLVVGRKRDS